MKLLTLLWLAALCNASTVIRVGISREETPREIRYNIYALANNPMTIVELKDLAMAVHPFYVPVPRLMREEARLQYTTNSIHPLDFIVAARQMRVFLDHYPSISVWWLPKNEHFKTIVHRAAVDLRTQGQAMDIRMDDPHKRGWLRHSEIVKRLEVYSQIPVIHLLDALDNMPR